MMFPFIVTCMINKLRQFEVTIDEHLNNMEKPSIEYASTIYLHNYRVLFFYLIQHDCRWERPPIPI
jgi:hypothetical protein